MKVKTLYILAAAATIPFNVAAKDMPASGHGPVSDKVIAQQRHNLKVNTEGKGFGPQSPRDIDSPEGSNAVVFNAAPAYSQMSLCNIHFHKNAEHKGKWCQGNVFDEDHAHGVRNIVMNPELLSEISR